MSDWRASKPRWVRARQGAEPMASAEDQSLMPLEDQNLMPPEPSAGASRGYVRRAFASSRGLVRIVHRDPEHVAERLTLYAVKRIADESTQWAQSTLRNRPDTPRSQIAEELRSTSAQIARIDGAISGTPFFIALVPGYLMYLLQ